MPHREYYRDIADPDVGNTRRVRDSFLCAVAALVTVLLVTYLSAEIKPKNENQRLKNQEFCESMRHADFLDKICPMARKCCFGNRCNDDEKCASHVCFEAAALDCPINHWWQIVFGNFACQEKRSECIDEIIGINDACARMDKFGEREYILNTSVCGEHGYYDSKSPKIMNWK